MIELASALEMQLEGCRQAIIGLQARKCGDAERIAQIQTAIANNRVAYAALATALHQVYKSGR